MIKRILATSLVLTVTWTTARAAAPQTVQGSPEATSSVESATQFISSFSDRTELLRPLIDRTEFDLEALGDELGWEAEPIIEFVRDEIEFEQYPGLLRGATGTLMSRAGNTLDQAVLLATLLRDAGYDARILQGELSPEQGQSLLGQMKPSDGPNRDPGLLIREAGSWDELWPQEPGAIPPWSPPTLAEVDAQAERLHSLIKGSGVKIGGLDDAEILEEARTYYWIEHKLGPSHPWAPVHPAFEENPGWQLVPTRSFTHGIPIELQHRFRIRAFIERKIGDEIEVKPIMDPWERPVANLGGELLSFTNYPLGPQKQDWEQGIAAVVSETDLFMPVLNGKAAPGAMAFDHNGDLFSIDAMGMDTIGATALFQELGDQVESAASALGSLETEQADRPEDLRALTAQWIELTTIAPGGQERTERRMIVDRLGTAARQSSQVSPLEPDDALIRLFRAVDFVVAGAAHPATFVASTLLDELANLERLDPEVLARGLSSFPTDEQAASLPRRIPLIGTLNLFESDSGGSRNRRLYRSGPAVFALDYGLDGEQRGSFNTDIVFSHWRGFSWDGEVQKLAPEIVLRHGVWETFWEGMPLVDSSVAFGIRELQSVYGGKPTIVAPGQQRKLAALGLTENARAKLEQELASGYVLAFSDSLATYPRPAWWRLEPDSGLAVGMMGDGRGATATEYVLLIILVSVAVIMAYQAWRIYCNEEKSDTCCWRGLWNRAWMYVATELVFDDIQKHRTDMQKYREECKGIRHGGPPPTRPPKN